MHLFAQNRCFGTPLAPTSSNNISGGNTLKNFVALLALSAAALTATAAHASTMDSFTLTSSTDTYTFSLPASPSTSFNNYGDFTLTPVSITDNGKTKNGAVEFFSNNDLGGISIMFGQSNPLNDTGSQLFTISKGVPTFKLGTFTLTPLNGGGNYGDNNWGDNGCAGNTDSITISQIPNTSPVPEPSSIAFLSTGLLAAAGTIRRRFSR